MNSMRNSATGALSIDVEAAEFVDAPNERGTPERNLLMAVLERAILDFVGNDQKEIDDAEEWFFDGLEGGTYDSNSLNEFSFPWLCQQLDLDPVYVAETVKNMPKRGHRRVAPWYFMKREEEGLKQAS